MSVISKALKTAQREKDGRKGGRSPGSVPVLVPLKSRADTGFSWKRALSIGVAGAALLASIWFAMQSGSKEGRQVAVAVPTFDIAVPSPAPPTDTTPAATVMPSGRASSIGNSQDSELSADPAPPSRPLGRPRVSVRSVAAPRAIPPVTAADTTARPAAEPVQNGRLRIAVDQREGDAARLFAIGVAAHRAGDLSAAANAYERVLLIAPNDIDALNNMGVLLAATGEMDRAEQLLRKAVRLSPRNAGAWNNLGTVLAQRGQPNDAIASYQQALAIDPQHQGARVSLAQQHLAIGSGDKARELLLQVIAGNPAMAEAHYALGQAYELQKDWAGAIRAYGAFVRVAPPRLAADVGRVQARMEMLSRRGR